MGDILIEKMKCFATNARMKRKYIRVFVAFILKFRL